MQNKTLFSQHFLDNRLCQQPEWNEDALPFLEQIRPLWAKARQYGSAWNEAQTEEEFIKPVLGVLGWSFIVQAKAGRSGQVTRPDYALFASEASKQEAYPHQGHDEAFYTRALAIAEAKHWERPLSQKDASGRATWKAESNPSHQMVSYLVGTRSEWGILTNGVTWRLYSREVSSTASEFYEIDLGELLDSLPAGEPPSPVQVEQFKRWWLFFRRAAFTRQEGAQPFVQRVHEGSTLYAREVSERLKELVFEDVMPEIAGGFVAYRSQQMGIQAETPETLLEIYRASLSLLYKLLFLLYAEARSLLPMDNPDYRANSLTALAQWAAQQSDMGRRMSEATFATPRYDALLALFRRVDRGDPSLGIPRYNGGLFNPHTPENRFLESHKLSDLVVGRAIDLLVRDQGQPVDYAYISVRNLGAIYEGLLENRLRVLDAVKGQVQLVNDKGERKATGSYYTPDYIVEYIVEHTLDPILEARQADYAQAMGQVGATRKQLAKTTDPATNRRLQGELAEAERQAREAFLGIKVLDPAMGSGHFLVNAVDHLTDGIIQLMQAYHDAHPEVRWDWDPIQALIERVRAEIVQEMAVQGLNVDTRRLDDTALLTRLVMKRCIYGVDLNRMAVELAKVSLWLHSFTVGAPLSFLDHHLRWGNSLIGTDVHTVENAIFAQEQRGGALQFSLFGGPFEGLLDLTAVMIEVAERADATLADVHQSAQDFEALQKALTPYKQALDLWVSQYFGNKAAKEFMELYGREMLPVIRGERKVTAQQQAVITSAQALWQEKRYFHWDVEFPEVFVDLRERNWAKNPGFDAVIGNPPWGGEIDTQTFDYLKVKFLALHQRLPDTAKYFFGVAHDNTRQQGVFGQILPNVVLYAHEYSNLRKILLEHCRVWELINLGDNVFRGVTAPACILVAECSPYQEDVFVKIGDLRKIPRDRLPIHDNWPLESLQQKLLLSLPDYTITADTSSIKLLSHLFVESDKVIELASDISLGVHSGNNSAFIMTPIDIQAEGIENGISWSLLTGSDIDRYTTPEVVPQSILYIEWDTDAKKYANTISHLLKYKPQLEQRREAKEGKMPWYVLHWPRNRNLYQSPKVICRQTSDKIIATVDPYGHCVLNTVIVIRPDSSNWSPYFWAAVLNSKLLQHVYQVLVQEEERVFAEVKPVNLRKLPIRHITFQTPADIRAKELDDVQELYAAFNLKDIQTLARQHLPLRTDIVHDLLAYLAEQMIALNKIRQCEIMGFLAWLEREIGTPLEGLTGKTTILNYLGDYRKGEEAVALEDILAVLRKNQRKLGVQVAGRAFQERLAQEYQASLDKLLPIKSKLAATDRLIDQIVYALYGLTEEEIAIVEGSAA
ncbi:MAG: N-6 DNA methylase [Chloroflexota bacterium]